MKFKILKHTCLLLLLIDLLLFGYFKYHLCVDINYSSIYIYSESQVYFVYIQIAVGICFIISSIFVYLIEYKFSILVTFFYIIFTTLFNSFLLIVPKRNPALWLSHFEIPPTYPLLYPHSYSLVIVILGVLIYQKKSYSKPTII